MTREELFRAVGEVREDQIEAAEIVNKQIHPWRRFGALAACLALIVTVAAASGVSETWKWTAIVKSFNPGAEAEEEPDSWHELILPFNPADTDSGGEAAAGGLDGTDYRTDDPNRPTHPDWSTGVEVAQLSGPGTGETMMGMSACLAWLSPEEIFAQDTAIFRGTVRELHYFKIESDAMEQYYTRALVEVTDPIRGDLTAGETYSLLWLGARGYMSTSISGALKDLDVGGEAIFMPIQTNQDTGWKHRNSYFCYADLADFYLGEGSRFVFADTAEGLSFDRGTYEEIAEVETLDEVAAYIREQTGTGEQTQPAAEPAVPQTEPSETVNAAPTAPGPNGALELPGGAFVSEE